MSLSRTSLAKRKIEPRSPGVFGRSPDFEPSSTAIAALATSPSSPSSSSTPRPLIAPSSRTGSGTPISPSGAPPAEPPAATASLEDRATVELGRLIAAMSARPGRHLVLIRGYPDPDSLASAWAHARIAGALGLSCDIGHGPVVSRPENRAMVAALDLPLVRISGALDLARYDAISLVDAHAIDVPRRAGLACVSIVDHHLPAIPLEADFVDLRTELGSTSTIYASYLLCGGSVLPKGATMTAPLATALAYGIRSDTDDLLHAMPDDLRALAHLTPFVSHDLLRMFSRYPIGAAAMHVMGRALRRARVIGDTLVAGVGFVEPEDRDTIGQAADFIVRREGIRSAIVYGIVGENVDGSLRTTDPAFDPCTFLRDAFGVGPMGLPYGGGRRGKGGFQLPLGPLARSPERSKLWTAAKAYVEGVLDSRIRGAASRSGPSP